MAVVNYMIPLGLAAVTAVLLAGLLNMLRSGSASTSQKLMLSLIHISEPTRPY